MATAVLIIGIVLLVLGWIGFGVIAKSNWRGRSSDGSGSTDTKSVALTTVSLLLALAAIIWRLS